MKSISIFIFCLFFFSVNIQAEFLHEVIPFWQRKYNNHGAYSKLFERVLNRKHVSNLIIDGRADHFRLVLLLHHPRPWNYKSMNHSLYFRFEDIGKLMDLAKYLDAYLEGGYNFKIKLQGSRIKSLYFIHTKKDWPLNN